jgi:hypothetical protein
LLHADDNGCEEILAVHQKAGLSFKYLAGRLQDDAASHQVKMWIMLLPRPNNRLPPLSSRQLFPLQHRVFRSEPW